MTSTVDRSGTSLGGKYLTFFLAGEEYGVEILRVQEIISMMPITRVPRTPPYIRGVINLRGKVIPIMDLREKFGMPAAAEPEQVMIVITLPRRLITPRMYGGVRGTRVIGIMLMISCTRRISTPYSSPARKNVRYLPPSDVPPRSTVLVMPSPGCRKCFATRDRRGVCKYRRRCRDA